jgi:hypothetical protein
MVTYSDRRVPRDSSVGEAAQITVPAPAAGIDNGRVDSDDLSRLIADLGAQVNGLPENVPEVVPQLLALLDENDDPRAIAEIVDALGVARDEAASLAVLPYERHPDPVVRLAVTQAVAAGAESAAAMEVAAAALIRLSRDDVDAIRDWATFGIGSILEIDNDEVRAALFARLTDSSEGVRDEAVAGIARRRDTRAVEIVADFLAEDTVGPLVFEAAEYLADPRLYDALHRRRDLDPDSESLARALQACDRELQRARVERHTAFLAALERAFVECDMHTSPFMYCERDLDFVLLSVTSEPTQGWDVDGLLERADGDVEVAARLVVSDLAALD